LFHNENFIDILILIISLNISKQELLEMNPKSLVIDTDYFNHYLQKKFFTISDYFDFKIHQRKFQYHLEKL